MYSSLCCRIEQRTYWRILQTVVNLEIICAVYIPFIILGIFIHMKTLTRFVSKAILFNGYLYFITGNIQYIYKSAFLLYNFCKNIDIAELNSHITCLHNYSNTYINIRKENAKGYLVFLFKLCHVIFAKKLCGTF